MFAKIHNVYSCVAIFMITIHALLELKTQKGCNSILSRRWHDATEATHLGLNFQYGLKFKTSNFASKVSRHLKYHNTPYMWHITHSNVHDVIEKLGRSQAKHKKVQWILDWWHKFLNTIENPLIQKEQLQTLPQHRSAWLNGKHIEHDRTTGSHTPHLAFFSPTSLTLAYSDN